MVSTQPHSGVPARKSVAGISPVVLVNAAEVLLAEFGPDALTFRDLSIATGYSGDGIRQTCGSRAALIGRTWARAAGRFLALLTSLVDETHGDAWEKACAAAEASLLFPRQYPRSAALLEAVGPGDLVRRPLPAQTARQLWQLERDFVEVMRHLAMTLWTRDDDRAVDAMTSCIIDLPHRILRLSGCHRPLMREYLHDAVRGALARGVPPLAHRGPTCSS